MNKLLHTHLTPGHCENHWRVLERAYKKHIDNQNKTGRGKKYFEFVEEMDEILKGKKRLHLLCYYRIIQLKKCQIRKAIKNTLEMLPRH